MLVVQDAHTGQALVGAHITAGNLHYISDIDGKAVLEGLTGNTRVELSYLGYDDLETYLDLAEGQRYVLQMIPVDQVLGETVITGSKYEVKAAESSVTIEVLGTELIARNNSTSADKALQRVPGVEILDGQPNIRGGSGFSYGAGSRVLVLLDDVPILQADAGFPQWNDLPLELAHQIEVLKGAASSLYGSSAMNGVINLRTKYATDKPETGFFTYGTLFSPIDGQQWTGGPPPFEGGFSLYHKARIGQTQWVLGTFAKDLDSYNKGTHENYHRLSGSLKQQVTNKLSLGLAFNVNRASSSEFFFWKGTDSLFVGAPGTYSAVEARRYNLDPNLQYLDRYGNRHRLLGRLHHVDNRANGGRSNKSTLGYGEYQLHRLFDKQRLAVTTGVVHMRNQISAPLYGDTSFATVNLAVYLQVDKKIGNRMALVGGLRYEMNRLHTPELFNCKTDPITGQTVCDSIPNGLRQEARPVLRVGTNYRLSRTTFLRASWGQGYRYPTVAEQFIKTTFGGIPISPNPDLRSESGWTAELGLRQGTALGPYKGYLDVSVFESRYFNMIEFNFIDLFQTGFQSVNVGNTRISGLEYVLAGRLTTGHWHLEHLIGHTLVNPRFEQFDTSAQAYTSPTTEGQLNAYHSSSKRNVLKYRFRNTFKYDVELGYRRWSIGSSANRYSAMEAIDAVFEGFIVPGLRQYRQDHAAAVYIVNTRISYEPKDGFMLSVVANNVGNKAYSLRPGLMEAPRNIAFRLNARF